MLLIKNEHIDLKRVEAYATFYFTDALFAVMSVIEEVKRGE